MPDSEMAKNIAQHMRARGKSDDMIRDTLRTWDLADPEIDDILAHLDPAPDGPAPAPPANTDYAVDLAAQMRNDGRPDDLIRNSLRACDASDADIEHILNNAPAAGIPVRHELQKKEVEETGIFKEMLGWAPDA